MLRARINYGNFVCPSVCLSVTTRYRFNARSDRDSGSSPYDSLHSLVPYEVIWCYWVRWFPLNEGIKQGYPSQNRYFTTINSSSVKTVADRHRLVAYHSKHCRRAFQWYQHRWPWTTLNPQNRGFQWIFSDYRLRHTFSEWIAPKPFKIDQDNHRMKCSALNIDFNSVRLDPLGSRSPPYERTKFGYPLENVRFLLLSTNLAREWLQIGTDLLHIITSTADELSGGTNINDHELPWTPKIWVLSEFFAILACDET